MKNTICITERINSCLRKDLSPGHSFSMIFKSQNPLVNGVFIIIYWGIYWFFLPLNKKKMLSYYFQNMINVFANSYAHALSCYLYIFYWTTIWRIYCTCSSQLVKTIVVHTTSTWSIWQCIMQMNNGDM